MASPHDLHRQGKQNKNDIEELYELSDKTNKKVNEIDRKVDEIDTKVTTIGDVQQKHGRRLETVESTQGEHTTKLDEILGILKAS